MTMTPLDLFGLAAVTLMLAFYALERRHHLFILLFALSCLLGSAYGFLQGAWPFGLVELVWTAVVGWRWWSEYRSRNAVEERILAAAEPFLPQDRLRYAREFMEYREYQLFIEQIVDSLDDASAHIGLDYAAELLSYSRDFGSGDRNGRILRRLVVAPG